MNQLQVGDLVWIPDSTYGFDKPQAGYRHKISGPAYGLVIEVSTGQEPSKVKVSLGKIPKLFWFRENQIYKEDGEVNGKVC